MPPAHRGSTGSPMDRWTTASSTAIASGFHAAMAFGPQPKLKGVQVAQPASAAAGVSSSLGDLMSDDDDDEEDEEEEDDSPSGTTGKKGKAKSRSANGKKQGAGRSRDPAAVQHRKEQNRAAQREFRQRKQQYIRALEARVELLSSDHDTQVDRLRFALRLLLAENNTLRTIVASLAAFIGKGAIGGCMAEAGLRKEDLEDAMDKRSEQVMAEAWQNWPGAKECDALKQIRLDSNIPVDGLPESKQPLGNSSASSHKLMSPLQAGSDPFQTDVNASAPSQLGSLGSRDDAVHAGQSTNDSRKRKKTGTEAQHFASPAILRKSNGKDGSTGANLPNGPSSASTAPFRLQQQPSQPHQPMDLAAATMPPPAARCSPAIGAVNGPPFNPSTPTNGTTFASFFEPGSNDFASNPAMTPEMWQQQQQMANLYMLQQQQTPGGGLDASFLQQLFGDGMTASPGQIGNGMRSVGASPSSAGSLSSPSGAVTSAPMPLTTVSTLEGVPGLNDGSPQDASRTSFGSPVPSMPRVGSASPATSAGATVNGTHMRTSLSATQLGQNLRQQQPQSKQLHGRQMSLGEKRPALLDYDPQELQRRIARSIAKVNRVLRRRGFTEFLDLPLDFELTKEDLRVVEEQERSQPYLILASHGYEGDLQDELEHRSGDGSTCHKVLTRQNIQNSESSYIQLMYHCNNYRLNPSYRLPPILQPTALQLSQSHDPIIDGYPWATVRDALISHPEIDREEFEFEMIRSSEVHDGDILIEEMWELHRPLLVRYPMMASEKILRIANGWRRRRGQPPLTVDALWEDHKKLVEAEKKGWKELGEPFPLRSFEATRPN